jgi:hypothetical protein
MKARALALFFLALFLFLLPLSLLPLPPLGPMGLPPLYLYLFGAWGLVLLLAFFLFRRP